MSKKIAIITDVHGNASALRAVLADIDQGSNIEQVYCLGDMIGIGPDSNEVLEMLFSRRDVTMITGNHDEAILALIQGDKHPDSHAHAREHHQWLTDRLDPRFVPLLARLPRQIVREHGGKQLLMVHYHIKENHLSLPISEDPWMPIEKAPTIENLDAFYEGTPYDAVLFGHHHPKHFFKGEHRLYVNPGALGCTHQPLAPYALLHVEGDRLQAEIREVPYDNREFLLSYEKLEVPDRAFILQIFHGNQHLKQD
jgi:putative phosphoesterase